MQEHIQSERHRSRHRMVFLILSALVLLVPMIAMRFTSEVNWGKEDFGAAAALLGTGWLSIEFGFRLASSGRGRLLISAAVALAVLGLWAHLAVGIWPMDGG
ncbi:hypothetical protein [Pseudorhizobium flavum]|uniref:hypothetical protein n=1 Tax=Pseudorhizobium flavum TaxID=1335061 RepID=UPI0024903108|nr:hypothetical protein [Pseudorhizobium flavum]